MLAFFLLLFAEAGHAAGESAWSTYFNYPGFQLWKFINLAIFVGILAYLLKKPLSEGFKAKREQIRGELIRAEEEKQAALARLTETESKLARLDAEKDKVLTRAQEEANAEERRVAEEAEREASKLRDQAENEIVRSANQARADLRRLSAEETIRLAEEMIKGKIGGANDANLVKAGIESIGGTK